MDRAHVQIVVIFCGLLIFFGCKKEERITKSPPEIPAGSQKVFLVCEGSYQNGNSSLGLYIPHQDTAYDDVFKAVNHAKTLGDIFQSMIQIDEQFFLCINNSDKVLALDKDLSQYASANVTKPRYILPVNAGKAYISSLYTNKIFVFDPVHISIKKSIDLPAKNTEGMLLAGNKAYICPWDTATQKVYVVNTTNDVIADSFSVAGRAPSEILIDKEEKLWILSGNVAKGKKAYWTRIDPSTKQVLASFEFPEKVDPVKPVMNKTGDTIYFIEVNYSFTAANNGVFRMSIYDENLPGQPFIPAQSGQYFWALGISPFNGDIYVGDPKGFTQRSEVRIYNTAGVLQKKFSTGAGIGHFYFSW